MKMTETLAYRYSSESTQRELSNEHQHDRIYIVFENLCIHDPCDLDESSLSIGIVKISLFTSCGYLEGIQQQNVPKGC